MSQNVICGFAAIFGLVVLGQVLQPGLVRFDSRTDGRDSGSGSAESVGPVSRSAEAYSRDAFRGPVVDPEGRLWHFREVVENLARAFESDLGIEFHVLVAPNTPGKIRIFGTRTFEARHVGREAETGGILLVVDPVRNSAFITTSYQLEGALPDATLGLLARNQLAPYAAHDALGMAVMDVLHLLKDIALLTAAQGDWVLGQRYQRSEAFKQARRYLSGGGGALTALSTLPEHVDLKRRLSDEERLQYAPSADPLESVEALLRVQRDGIGDPTLNLFTPGSRVQRDRYPFALFEQHKRREALIASKPFEVLADGDRIVVTSARPVHGFVPVLLHRIDGAWRVDLVEMWKNLSFDAQGRFRQVNGNNPYSFGLRRYGKGEYFDVRALDVGDADPGVLLAELATREGALFRYLEGEILFRNCFVFPAAIAAYEAATEEAPHAIAFAERLGERARHVSFLDLATSAYARAGPSLDFERARVLARVDHEAAAAVLANALERDPYDAAALEELARVLRYVDEASQAETVARLERVQASSARESMSLEMRFYPPQPELVTDAPVMIGDASLFDYSEFRVEITNPSARPVYLQQVFVTTHGTASRSAVGEVRDQFSFKEEGFRIEPGASVRLDRHWGYTVDTAHQQVSYLFDYCWRGDGELRQQCRYARVDSFPR